MWRKILKKFFIFGELNKAGVVRASPPGETRENDTHQQPREKLTHSTENRVRTEPCQVHGTGPRREHVFPMPEFFFFLPPQRKGRGRNRISKKKTSRQAIRPRDARVRAYASTGNGAGDGGNPRDVSGFGRRNRTDQTKLLLRAGGSRRKGKLGEFGLPAGGPQLVFRLLNPGSRRRTDGRGLVWLLFFFLNLATILFLFVFNSYYLIID